MFEKLVTLFKEADVSFTMVNEHEIDVPVFAFLVNEKIVDNARTPFGKLMLDNCIDEEAHIRIYTVNDDPFLNWGILIHDNT